MNALIEAYKGYYEEDFGEVSTEQAKALISGHTPKERLAIYLEWNGILGFTETIWAISQGEH